MRNKLKGFLMTEVILSMTISSIAILLLVGVFHAIFKQEMVLQKINKNSSSILAFSTVFEKDFYSIENCKWVENRLEVIHANKNVVYEFMDTCIYRRQLEHVDTFFIKTSAFTISGYYQEDSAFLLPDTIKFDILNKVEKIPFIAYKQLTPAYIYPLIHRKTLKK